MLEQNGPGSFAVIAEIATRPDLLHIVAALGSMLGLAAHKLAEESDEERDASGWLRFLALENMDRADEAKRNTP
jgi:hypothetical protein